MMPNILTVFRVMSARAVRGATAIACKTCLILVIVASGPGLAHADDDDAAASVSFDASQVDGQPFFLLSDRSFGSGQMATVRLEAPGQAGQSQLAPYGGADIVVYRVPNPMAFLKAQKNLHRLNIAPNYTGEGLANTVAFLWNRWFTQSREAWQRVLSYAARENVVKAHPQFKRAATFGQGPSYELTTQFAPLKGYDLVARFRYPIWDAKPIEPPKGVNLAGSSSNFLQAEPGNVMIPVGKLAPGLYIVEALIGNYRAHTLLFVSDTVGVVKAASQGLLIWTAHRGDGKPAPDTDVAWTDGVGVLTSGKTGDDGALVLNHVDPEHSYVLGVDHEGGVFVSENFYYDSEVYNTKIYAFTDRPMYRAGETVHVKFMGRTSISGSASTPAPSAPLSWQAIDPDGDPIASATTPFDSATGGQADFTLPADATAGGYTLQFRVGQDVYASAFRVAEYVKPHFDVTVQMSKSDYGTGEPVQGQIQLRYPDGSPVRNARVSLTLRAQSVSMVDGDLRYSGLFPVKLDQQELRTGDDGNVAVTLPAAKDPSRYALTLFAQDSAAYRTRVTREILIGRGDTPYTLTSPTQFTQAGESVTFTLRRGAAQDASTHAPATWESVRLESQTREQGPLPSATGDTLSVPVSFKQPGSYMVSVKDAAGNLLAATGHWVAGDGLTALPGSVEIVFDKHSYQVGDTAQALITFPYAVDDALLTLERDSVEQRALLSHGADWLGLTRVAPNQWQARIKVAANFAPNLTFSVLYLRDGQYAFQNAGIVVAKPTLALDVASDRASYAPGDTVTLHLTSTLAGKPVPAHLTVSVVDDLVYVLQPEIAPSIVDFFNHPERNNVRTSSSLSFVTYDLAVSGLRGAPRGPAVGNYNERGVKILERPRRDEQDTAAWAPNVRTDASGHATLTFRMPDSLARWRVTVRAMADDGTVGQRTAYLRSDKPLYLTWSGPTHFRVGDTPTLGMIAFNHTSAVADVQWRVSGGGLNVNQTVTLKPGVNYLQLPVTALQAGTIDAQLWQAGKPADSLETTVSLEAAGWLAVHQQTIPLDGAPHPLSLGPDTHTIRLRMVDDVDSQFSRIVDDLITVPEGSAEQTASRLIPLALAHAVLAHGANGQVARELETRLRNERQRLAMLAGVNGTFGWWGDTTGNNLLLTSYAYYADWLAARSLGINLPDGNWQHALDLYRTQVNGTPTLQRALALWFLQQMGLPVATPVQGVADQLLQDQADDDGNLTAQDSVIFADPSSSRGLQMAFVLVADMARDAHLKLSQDFADKLAAAQLALARDPSPLSQSLLFMSDPGAADKTANAAVWLAQSGAQAPTMDRSLTLLWLRRALGGASAVSAPIGAAPQGADWRAYATPTGATSWHWEGATPPDTLTVGTTLPNASAVLTYSTPQAQASQLPVDVHRTWYRLLAIAPDPKTKTVPLLGQESFQAIAVKPGEAFDTNALYVDEIRLVPHGGSFAYGLVDAPLPPGGSVEATSWGVDIAGLPGQDSNVGIPGSTPGMAAADDASATSATTGTTGTTGTTASVAPTTVGAPGSGAAGSAAPARISPAAIAPQPFVRAVLYNMGDLNYRQPVMTLDGPLVLRQLVRFALPGTFVLPPVRYFRMYQPDEQAYEGGKSDRLTAMQIH